ncbi:interleukin-34 isoform 2-T2 [Erethizon dorsatum]
MPRGLAWLHYFGILLGVALGNEGLEVWPLTQNKECAVTGFLRDKLQYKNRLQYMKHYFPINYRISVPYEGVLRIANITRLRAQVSAQELRYLWVLVSLSATESVQDVLLEGHPSWRYLEEVRTLLLNVQRGLVAQSIRHQLRASEDERARGAAAVFAAAYDQPSPDGPEEAPSIPTEAERPSWLLGGSCPWARWVPRQNEPGEGVVGMWRGHFCPCFFLKSIFWLKTKMWEQKRGIVVLHPACQGLASLD